MPSYDVMPNMELYQPVRVEDALDIASRYADRGWLVGGGQDTYGWLKDRAKRADALIDLSAIESLRGVRETADGIEIGALTTLTEIAENGLLKQSYSLLSKAASVVASPQIRNIGTLGGNVSQDVRCWYYRRGLSCYRAGGNLCYADTPQGMNREHSLFETSRCVAAGASDTAPALVALDATMVLVRLTVSARCPPKSISSGLRSISRTPPRYARGKFLLRLGCPKPGPMRRSIMRRSPIAMCGISHW